VYSGDPTDEPTARTTHAEAAGSEAREEAMVAANVFMIVFRIVHVLAGAIWFGALTLLVFFIQPSGASLGPAGGPFVQELMARRRLPSFILSMGGLTVVAGLFLYWKDWHDYGSFSDWVSSDSGLVLTVGAVAAIAALMIGGAVVKPTLDRALALGAELMRGGGPPPEDRAAELRALQMRARTFARIVFALLTIAILTMAAARYA
jgi:uncharacterized membrane protein